MWGELKSRTVQRPWCHSPHWCYPQGGWSNHPNNTSCSLRLHADCYSKNDGAYLSRWDPGVCVVKLSLWLMGHKVSIIILLGYTFLHNVVNTRTGQLTIDMMLIFHVMYLCKWAVFVNRNKSLQCMQQIYWAKMFMTLWRSNVLLL